MGLNREIAARLAEQRLREWRKLSYQEWKAMIDDSELREVIAEDGRTYSIAVTAWTMAKVESG